MSDDPNAQSTAAVVSSHNTAAGSLPQRAFEQGSKERERESRRLAALPTTGQLRFTYVHLEAKFWMT